ncbi:MAG TPA: CPBP family intramembrane metalloprotease [Cyanothece sp. UBA12306]|nr:CPBP family intramembrane metalloprotease [Cyanothece sp. UBA12306]
MGNYPAPLRLGIFIFLLLLLWLPGAIPLYLVLRNDPNLTTIITMGLLYIEFIGLLFFWNLKVYNAPYWWREYGLAFNRKNTVYLLNGLSLGLLFTFSLFIVESLFGWVRFNAASSNIIKVILEGLLSSLGIGLAEELFFRGWLLAELKRNYSPSIVLWTNALIFAVLHFIKPLSEIIRTLPQFPALVLLGLTLIWAKRSHKNYLGICIGLHGGLVWGYYIVNVGKIIQYTDKISSWITGIDNNPLAGIMGLIFLGILAFCLRKSQQIT